MKEDLLHYVWRLGRFDHCQMKTTQGAPIDLVRPGHLNTNAGPDFLEARLKIDNTLWAGCVEMHLRASDWYRHGHDQDPAYRNVILHVVWEEDREVYHPGGARVPCLELKGRIEKGLIGRYRLLLGREHWIPCQPFLREVELSRKDFWLGRLAVERLSRKTRIITGLLEEKQGDWEAAFFHVIARTLLGRVNRPATDRLLQDLPYSLLRKSRHRLFVLEALLFGHSGLLPDSGDESYPRQQKEEYDFLARKHRLSPLPAGLWKFMRMRPANFPTLRLAQLATLLHCNEHLFSKAMAAGSLREVENLFQVEVSQYWKGHYRFGKESRPCNKRLGKATIHTVAINAVAPFQFLYGKLRHRPELCERALQLWQEIPPERNRVLRRWRSFEMPARSAFHSQALLELKKDYCDAQRCLHCQIGQAILGPSAPKGD